MDMSMTIAPKSTQLNADDLIAGPRTITIAGVSANPSSKEQPVVISFEGDNGKPYLPCLSMRRVMVHCWGKDAQQYVGRSMTIYRDPEVTWGGMKVGGIRISHMSHLDKPEVMALTATQKQRKPYRVDPLKAEPAQGNAPSPDAALTAAKSHAQKGKDAFLHWYNSEEGKAVRDLIKPHMGDLKALCEKADESANPFDTGEVMDGTGSTPEEEERLAQIAREIEEENRKQAEGVE